ncbi:DUF3606 domain-containing protein [Rhodoligotrophos appendicifer]|uniref:DUF3606 domain-containing protein n=1 Tax=Rhodoligotrophos appendicifer TaxID=987056 RepID=UPI00117E54FF|nr:DUF3606 domain-containing protein [Rhodoligotrophos appendicifer]
MADDKSKTDASDRRMVSAEQDYEVQHFAKKHNLTTEEVVALIAIHGNDRATLGAAVQKRTKTA